MNNVRGWAAASNAASSPILLYVINYYLSFHPIQLFILPTFTTRHFNKLAPASVPTTVTSSRHLLSGACPICHTCHRICQNCLGPRAEHRVISFKFAWAWWPYGHSRSLLLIHGGIEVVTQVPSGGGRLGLKWSGPSPPSRWIFKIKKTPEGLIDKYKARLVAQGFSQVPGVHYGEVLASMARFAAVRTVITLAATEDLELEAVDISTAFLNRVIDKEVYMRVPDGFEVEGEPCDGKDPKCWVVCLLKGLYRIKQGPHLWALKLHSVLSVISFQHIDCDYLVYMYRRGDVKIFLPIHVDDLQWLKKLIHKGSLFSLEAGCTSGNKVKPMWNYWNKAYHLGPVCALYWTFSLCYWIDIDFAMGHTQWISFCADTKFSQIMR